NPRTGGDLHFDHHQPKEGLYRVRADFHAGCDLFAGEALAEVLHGFALPLRQAKALGHLRRTHTAGDHPLQQHCEGGLWTEGSIGIDLKRLADVAALARLNFFDENLAIAMLPVEQRGAHSIGKKDLRLFDPAGLAGEAKDLQGWIVRRYQIQLSIQQQKAAVARRHGHGALLSEKLALAPLYRQVRADI